MFTWFTVCGYKLLHTYIFSAYNWKTFLFFIMKVITLPVDNEKGGNKSLN